MKCCDCGKQVEEVCTLSEYGCNKLGVYDLDEYCGGCFDQRYPTLHDKDSHEESDD